MNLNQTPRPGDILLFYNAGGLARLVTWYSGSPFYHVAIYAGEGHVLEARPRGVVRRDLSGPIGGRDFAVIRAPGQSGPEALAWAQRHLGDNYGFLNVAGLMLDRVFQHLNLNRTLPGQWSCGDYVATAFAQAGHDLFAGRNSANLLPKDFALLLRAPLDAAKIRENPTMWTQRIKECVGIVLIGDGAIGLLNPRRHSRLWKSGPQPYQKMMRFFIENPLVLRVLSAAEIALGYWLATRAETK